MELNNNTNGMKEAQTMLGEQVSQMQLKGFSTAEIKPRRSAPRRPACWSMRVDLPMVRETPTNANGDPIKCQTPENVAALCADLGQLAQEAFVVIDLTAKNTVNDKRLISLGVLDASLVAPREVFRGAIVGMAKAVILAHNHPSGDPSPSAEDIRITRQLIEAGKILDIKVLDHVIIGRPSPGNKGFYSLRETGLVDFAA